MEGLKKAEQAPLKEEEKKMDFDSSNSEVAGGVSKDYGNADAVKAADQVRAEALTKKIEEASGSKEQSTPALEEKPLDVSLIKNQIEALKSKKKGLFDFGRTQDSINLLNIALKKINNPNDKSYAEHYMAALSVDDDFAMEYARDIGAGKLVYPDAETRTIMTTRKNSAKNYFGE